MRVLVGDRTEIDHPGFACGGQVDEQQAGKREVAQHICAELQLESVDGGTTRPEQHRARVVDKQVDRRIVRTQFRRKAPHGGKGGQIQLPHLDLTTDPPSDLLTSICITHSKHNMSPPPSKLGSAHQPQPRIRTRHNGDPPPLVGNAVAGPSTHLLLLRKCLNHRNYEQTDQTRSSPCA